MPDGLIVLPSRVVCRAPRTARTVSLLQDRLGVTGQSQAPQSEVPSANWHSLELCLLLRT